MKCDHLDGELWEWVEAAHVRQTDRGILDGAGENELGQIIGYEYRCDSCGKRWMYRSQPRQKWLQRIHRQLLGEPSP